MAAMSELNPELKKNIDERGASRILGLAVQTLRNQRFKREGPTYCKLGRRVFYQITDLYAYIDKHKIRPEGE